MRQRRNCLSNGLRAFACRDPHVTLRRILHESSGLRDRFASRVRRHGRLGSRIEHDVAGHGAAVQRQAEAVLGIAAGSRDLNVAVDLAVAGHRHADGGVARIAAHVKRKVAFALFRNDGAAVDDNIAVVVGQRVTTAANKLATVERHVVQRQVAVVLDKHQRLLRIDRAVLEGDLVVLLELERLSLCAGRADRLAVHRVGEPAEVDRQTVRLESVGENLDAVAGAVAEQGDGVAVNRSRKRSFQGLVLGVADLGDVLDRHKLAVGIPLVVSGSSRSKASRLGHRRLRGRGGHGGLGGFVEDDAAVHGAASQGQGQAVLGVVVGSGDLHVTVDHGGTCHGHADGGVAAVAAHVERHVASLRRDRRVVDHNVAVVIGHCVTAPDAGAVNSHAIQRQVAVVLDQEASILRRGRDLAVREGDGVVPQQLEAVVFRSAGTNTFTAEVVGMTAKVNRQTGSELALRHLDAVAGAVSQHRDGVAVLGRRKGSFQGLVLGLADLSDVDLGDQSAVLPLVVSGSSRSEVSVLGHSRLLGRGCHGRLSAVGQHDVAVHLAALKRQAEAVLRVAVAGIDLHVTVDLGVAGHGHVDGGVAAVAADIERYVARLRSDRGVLDHNVAVVVGQHIAVAARQVSAVQRHVVQSQIAVVLDQHLCLRGGNSTILEGDLVVLQ